MSKGDQDMTNDLKPGLAVADYLRNDDRGPWQGVTHTCRSCERPTIEHLEDGYCSSCNGVERDDSEERKTSRVALYKRTAKLCRKNGDTEGAAWFEGRIREESI